MQEELSQFEDQIMNDEASKIKYSIDRDIESSVKQHFLSENYGKENVDDALRSIQKNFLDLWDPAVFSQVSEILAQTK